MICANIEELNAMSLNQLYRVITGNTQLDVEKIAEQISELEEPAKTAELGKLLYTVAGGCGVTELVATFRTKLYEAIGGVVADVDGDGDVDQDDYDAVKAGQDITGDDKVDEADLDLVKALSTAEIEEVGDDEPIEEDEEAESSEGEDEEITE